MSLLKELRIVIITLFSKTVANSRQVNSLYVTLKLFDKVCKQAHSEATYKLTMRFVLTLECGSVVNNSLKSPGYANNYPQNMHCVYSIDIPQGMEMKIDLKDFEMEDTPSCL